MKIISWVARRFLAISEFINCAFGLVQDAPMTVLQTNNIQVVLTLIKDFIDEELSSGRMLQASEYTIGKVGEEYTRRAARNWMLSVKFHLFDRSKRCGKD